MTPERLLPDTAEWDAHYHEHRQRYEFALPFIQGCNVLDAACGVGYGSALLAQRGACSVVGLDLSQHALEQARSRFTVPGVTFVRGDVLALPFDDASFDAIVSFETVEHVANPDGFMCEVARVLRPGGVILCSTPNRDFRGRTQNPHHIHELSLDEFRALFEAHFSLEGEYAQSHSEEYLRYVDLVREVARLEKAIRFSLLLRAENAIRRALSKEQWDDRPLPRGITRGIPGDYVIEPLHEPSDRHVTYLFAGHAPDLYPT
jgi:ubiquinone/menaquinone biosynthesis C-methylase UbiE